MNEFFVAFVRSFENMAAWMIHRMKTPKHAELTQHSVIPAKAGIQASGGGEQTWIPACAGMTSRGGNVLREPPPFSCSVGERKIMNHFVVRKSFGLSASAVRYLNFSLLLAPCSLLFIAVITTLLSAAPAPAQVRQDQAKLANVVGQVEVLRRGTTAWQPAKSGMPLSAGDEVRAAQNSGAEIAMVDGSILMVFAQSRLQIRQLTSEAQTRTSMFHLVVGLVRYVVSQAGVTLVGTRQNQFTISTPTAVMAARGTDGILGYSAAAAVAATPAVPSAAAAGGGGQTTLLCLGGVSALVVLSTVPGTVGTGEQIFCENGQIWNIDAGRLTLLTVLPNAVRAALEAGASPQAIQQIVQSMTPVQLTWTPLEQAIYDAAPFNLQGPTQAEVTQVAMAALNTNLPTTTIATAQTTPANIVQVQNFEQAVSGITTTSDVQKEQVVRPASPFTP